MRGRIRLAIWRWSVPLALLYLAFLGTWGYALWWYMKRMPTHLDTGLTVAMRSWLYQRTFKPLAQVRKDLETGNLADAEARLVRFLEEHPNVQRGQIDTHAVTDASELLAEVYRRQRKFGRAGDVLDAMTLCTPFHWRLWFIKGKILREAGDLQGAADAYRSAFKIALNRAEVVEEYIDLLGDLYNREDIVWVADEFERAARRGLPLVTIKVGAPRSALQSRVLSWTGVPVEHGAYVRSLDAWNRPRGRRQTLAVPRDLVQPAASPAQPISVQLRFEGIYDALSIDAVRCWKGSGELLEYELPPERISFLHRPFSGVEYYAEFTLDQCWGDVDRLEIVYSCPDEQLSEDTIAAIADARLEMKLRGSDP